LAGGSRVLNMFFRKPPFGVDISDYSIEIISLAGTIKNSKLLAMGRITLEPGIFEDGKILGKEELKKNLKSLIENPKFGKIKHPLCGYPKIIFAIPESKSYIHIFELPKNLKKTTTPPPPSWKAPREVLELVKSQASQTFPYSLAELYFDFQIYDQEILLIAAPKKIVNDYLEVFKDSNLTPVALEIESLSLARALVDELRSSSPFACARVIENSKPLLIADIGARTTNLSVFDPVRNNISNGAGKIQLRLSFSVPIAGNRFSQALSEKLNIPQAAAEGLKREIGLNPEYQEGKVFLILQKEIQGIIGEINKIKKYFQEKTGKIIEKIILAGGSSVLPRLPEYFAENLDLPVEIGDPWVKINIDILKKKEYFKTALEVNPIFYSTVIGTALRGLSKDPSKVGINLLKNISR